MVGELACAYSYQYTRIATHNPESNLRPSKSNYGVLEEVVNKGMRTNESRIRTYALIMRDGLGSGE